MDNAEYKKSTKANSRKKRKSKIAEKSLTDKIIKEKVLNICQCCLSRQNLRSMLEVHCLEGGQSQTHSETLSKCFSLECLQTDTIRPMICEECIGRLNEILEYRLLVERSRSFLLNKTYISNSFTNEIENSNNDLETDFQNNDDSPSPVLEQNVKKSDSISLPYTLDKSNLTCVKCKVQFNFYKELVAHMPEHYPNHICDVCGKICASWKSMFFHRKTHSDQRYRCEKCGKEFKTKRYLGVHTKVAHSGGSLEYKCQNCDEVFVTYNARLKHLVEKHGQEDKMYKCTQCTNRYRLGSQLRAHVRSKHLQEKTHECAECGRAFFTRRLLSNHAARHTGERRFACPLCPRVYGRESSLRRHTLAHSRGHACETCGRTFTQADALIAHSKKHGDVEINKINDALNVEDVIREPESQLC